MNNNYAFIDGQNLHFGIKSLGWKLDHKKFRQYLGEEHNVTKAYIFLGFMEEHQDLYNVLQEAGFICFFKPLVRYDDGSIKGNVDADMVLQVMVDIEKYDKAVIVSGDGDFSGLLRHLIMRKKLGQIIIPNQEKYSSLFDRLEGFDESHVTYMNGLRSRLSYFDPRRASNYQNGQGQANSAIAKKAPSALSVPASRTSARPMQSSTGKGSAAATAKPAPRKRPSAGAKPAKPARTNNKRPGQPRGKKEEFTFKPKAELERSLIDTIDNFS